MNTCPRAQVNKRERTSRLLVVRVQELTYRRHDVRRLDDLLNHTDLRRKCRWRRQRGMGDVSAGAWGRGRCCCCCCCMPPRDPQLWARTDERHCFQQLLPVPQIADRTRGQKGPSLREQTGGETQKNKWARPSRPRVVNKILLLLLLIRGLVRA